MSTDSFSGSNAFWANVKLPPWWLILIEGILLIILGFLFFTSPYQTLVAAVWVLGIYWIIRGIFELISLIWDRSMWGWKIFAGILSAVAGWILFQQPFGGALVLTSTLVFILGFIGIFMGISGLFQGFKGAGWPAILMGIISIVLGIILLMNARGAAAWMPFALGILAIFNGIIALFGAFRVRGLQKDMEEVREQAEAVAARATVAQAMPAAMPLQSAAEATVEAAEVEEVEAADVDDMVESAVMAEAVDEIDADEAADMMEDIAEAAAEAEVTMVQDLTVVEGIGPKISETLQAAGVNTYAELAALSPEQIHAILKDASLSADPTTWPEQAELAAKGKMDELKAYQDKLQGGREE